MNATKRTGTINKLAVDIFELQSMLGCGKKSAEDIGKMAGAIFHIGRRKLYNVEKIQMYMNAASQNETMEESH